MWLVSDASQTLCIPETAAEKKKNAAAFVVKEDFLYYQTVREPVIPSNTLLESGGKRKINHHTEKQWGKRGNNSGVSALITSTAFVFVPF